jgi:micrococcal nuclease
MLAKLRSNKILFYVLAFVLSATAGYYFFPKIAIAPEADRSGEALYAVVEVIDGDTIKAEIDGKVESVRLIGIDTPEIAGPYAKEECFGNEASLRTKELLNGKKVFLVPDDSVSDRDKYGRLLRYVFLPDGKFVNAELVKDGYAFNYAYENFQYLDHFNNLEKQAKEVRSGLWASGCDYYFETK